MTAGVRRLLATYRLQLHRDFTFAQAAAITPYLRGLGVSHAYTSPITRARSGSNHGYDVVDPTEVNPDLGGERGRVTFVRRLHREGLGLLLDIVPNHMGTGSENPFWEDVLTHGAGSRYARWFDIRWGSADELLAGRILLPVLGDKFTRALERGEITVEFSHRGIRVRYFDKEFPADPATIPMLLAPVSAGRGVPRLAARDRSSLETILTELQALPPRAPPEVASRNGAAAAPRSSAAEPPLRRLSVLWKRSPTVRRYVERRLAGLTMGTANRERLRAFLDAQPYRLAHWKRAARLINYRRFFDINELAAVRVEDPAVFAATHALILEWVRRGETDGLRIDHVDGLL
ncbi:MAG: alpha-amylase family glycosyl hydrolase, partial [Gemmatimonadaceae bacterium]